MTFSKAGEHLLINDHIEMPDAFRGKGIGLKLVMRAVGDARAPARRSFRYVPSPTPGFAGIRSGRTC